MNDESEHIKDRPFSLEIEALTISSLDVFEVLIKWECQDNIPWWSTCEISLCKQDKNKLNIIPISILDVEAGDEDAEKDTYFEFGRFIDANIYGITVAFRQKSLLFVTEKLHSLERDLC
jgi:hypothetical protein